MKKFAILLCSFFMFNLLIAQHELGLSIGTSHLLGDFGGGPGTGTIFLKDIDFQATRPAIGLFYRYNFLKVLSARAQFKYGSFFSSDAFTSETFRSARGLSAQSKVFDGSLQLEYNIIPLKYCSSKNKFSPFIAAGIALTSTQAAISSYRAEGVPSTETQFIQLGNVLAFNIPFTAGVKYKLKQNFVFGLEASYRLAFTDKLDAYVRQENDHFFFISATISYVFCKGGFKANFGGASKCPTFD